MRPMIIVVVGFSLLTSAMTCNPDPQRYVINAEKCVNAMQEFARDSKERGKQMAVIGNILGRSSLQQDEQIKLTREIAEEMKRYRCEALVPFTPVPTPTPRLY